MIEKDTFQNDSDDLKNSLTGLNESKRLIEGYAFSKQLMNFADRMDSLVILFPQDKLMARRVVKAQKAAMFLNDLLRPIEDIVEEKISKIEPKVIKNIELELKMTDSIAETINDKPVLLDIFPNPDLGTTCVKEFFTSLLQITEFKGVNLEDCDYFTKEAINEKYSPTFAAEISKNTTYINDTLESKKSSFNSVLEDAVTGLKKNLKEHYSDEFDDEKDPVNNQQQVSIKSDEFENILRNYGLGEDDRNLLDIFLSDISESDDKDRKSILKDPTGFEASLAISRRFGMPFDERTKKLGTILANALTRLLSYDERNEG